MRVAVIDYVMPERDGVSLVEEILRDERFADLKIIMLSSAGHQARRHCQDLGLPACLERPVFQTDLLHALAQVLGQSVGAKPPTETSEADGSVEGETAGPRLNILVTEDTPANQKLLQLVLQMRGHHVSLAKKAWPNIARLRRKSRGGKARDTSDTRDTRDLRDVDQ